MDLILLQPGNIEFNPPLEGSNNITVPVPPAIPDFDVRQCIQLISAEQGVSQPMSTNVNSPSRALGPFAVGEFTCTKLMTKNSPKFFDFCAQGESIGMGKDRPTYIYIISTAADKSTAILYFTLRDALISNLQVQAGSGYDMTEQFKLNFTEIIWTYQSNDPEGNPVNNVTAGWSSLTNTPILRFSDQ